MQYNFDEIIDRRNTNALNTDGFRGYIFHAGPEKVFPFKDEEFVRMWVADMEFACCPAICDAIKERVDKRSLMASQIAGQQANSMSATHMRTNSSSLKGKTFSGPAWKI